MFVVLFGTDTILIIISYPRPSQRDPLIDWKMWFLSRCLSIDSFHSCLSPAKNRTSYDFCFCSDRLKIFSAKSDDEDESSSSKKPLRYQHRAPLRRRLPKRYSDIVGPLATKAMHFHNDPYFVSSQARRTSINLPRRHSTKMGTNETFQYLRSSRRKTRQTLPPFPHLKLPETRNFPLKSRRHSDDLAHRMQAVMSSELMHSLDRNFVFGDRNKLYPQYSLVPRSQSFNICTLSNNYNRKVQPNHYHQLIPRVKYRFKQEEELTISELTPDYNEQFILKKSHSARFEDTKQELAKTINHQFPTTIHELDEKTLTRTEPGLSSSFIVPPSVTSLSNGEQEQDEEDEEDQEEEEQRVDGDEQKQEVQYESPEPPLPPPPKPTTMPKTYLTIRCRTIADNLTPDHKLILKDGDDEPSSIPTQSVTPFPPPPASISSYESLSQADENVDDTEMTTICAKPSATTDDRIRDPNLSSSSPATSVFIDQDYEPRSSSSKIYHDYKKRTSSISIPTSSSTRLTNSTLIVHPMHTKIGFRSSTSSSSMRNEKFSSDMTLTGKQMNVCVINQLNEHLSTRFRQHQTEEQEQETYDLPPPEESNISSITPIENNSNENNSNVYDEPNELLMTNNLICSASSSIPPPPPPLPVGGFRSIKNPVHDHDHHHPPPSLPPRTQILSSTRTSTISSNLSDTRILHELRANPLFTRAKEHLDMEPGSSGRRSGRRLIGSTMNLGKNEETVSYLRLNHANKTNHHRTSPPSKSSMETIILHPNELNRMIGKRTKSSIDINQSKTSKYLSTTACRQSELEMIFQKRAQRHSQNLS